MQTNFRVWMLSRLFLCPFFVQICIFMVSKKIEKVMDFGMCANAVYWRETLISKNQFFTKKGFFNSNFSLLKRKMNSKKLTK